jgi:hypothetical protein
MGRFLPVESGPRLIMLVGGMVIAGRSPVASAPVHAALPDNGFVG